MKIIVIDGVIGWDITTDEVRDQLKEANGEDVLVEISSPGGLISQGLTIFNLLKNYQGRVDTHIIGQAASMATYISQVGEKRTAEKNSVFMIHNGWGLAIGDHREMFKYGKHLDSLTNIIAKQYSTSTDREISELRTLMDDETFFYGDEIQEAGFVDEVTGDESEDSTKDEAFAMAQLSIDECIIKISTPEMIKKDMTAISKIMMVGEKQSKPGQPENKQEVIKMTLEELKEKHPELYAQVMALGFKDGEKSGIETERTRVKSLTEMRSKFKKDHSQKVIDQAITDGHDTAQVSINLMAADQAAEELEKANLDNPETPPNGDDDTPEMIDGNMTHQDHIDSTSDEIAKSLGIKK